MLLNWHWCSSNQITIKGFWSFKAKKRSHSFQEVFIQQGSNAFSHQHSLSIFRLQSCNEQFNKFAKNIFPPPTRMKPCHWNNFHLKNFPFYCYHSRMFLSWCYVHSTTRSHCLPIQLNTSGKFLAFHYGSECFQTKFQLHRNSAFVPEKSIFIQLWSTENGNHSNPKHLHKR